MIPVTPIILPMPFAANGDKNVIATTGEASQPNATWAAGFPAITRLPKQAGGLPPLGLDFNGIFNALSQHIVFLQSGGVYPWAGADAASGFAGLDYLAGARVLGSDGATYVALKGSGPNTPASSGTGFVGPVDPVSDTTGVWSSLGGALLYNREEIITASGMWEAPVTGWYSIFAIDGGSGAYHHVENNFISGGVSGAYKSGVVKFVKGQKVAITVGAGGKGTTNANPDILSGGVTEVEGVDFSAYSGNGFATIGVQNNTIPQIRMSGAGFGGGYYNTNGRWWGGGGGGLLNTSGVYEVHDGKQGAVIMRWHDPAYAGGAAEAGQDVAAAQADVATQSVAPVMARMSARRVAAAPADMPAEEALVNLYDPETGKGSVWRVEDAPAKLAGGMLSEEAWRERCEAKATEERAAWLASPATEAERFEMLRAARDAKLAACDYLMASDYPLSEDARAQVAEYRQTLRDLPEQEGAPWDGGGKETPWPVKAEMAIAGAKAD